MDPQRLAERDRRLLAGEHPGLSDHSYRLACRHAERLGAAAPTRLPRGLAESVVPHPLGLLQRVIVDVDDHVSEGEVIGEQLAKLRGVVKQPDAAVVGAPRDARCGAQTGRAGSRSTCAQPRCNRPDRFDQRWR